MNEAIQGESVRARLRRVLRDALQLDELPDVADLHRRDVKAWDSVSHLRLMLEIEQEFEVTLDDEEFVGVDALSEIEDILRRAGVTDHAVE